MPRFSLVPQELVFYDLFKEDIANALKAAKALQDMANDYTNIIDKARAIKAIEHDGDTITHEIIKTLNKTFVTPFDREDIYALCTNVDDVVDLIEAVADACVLYQVRAPTEHLREGVNILVLAVQELQKAFDKLSSFSGLQDHWIEANSLEPGRPGLSTGHRRAVQRWPRRLRYRPLERCLRPAGGCQRQMRRHRQCHRDDHHQARLIPAERRAAAKLSGKWLTC